MLLLLLSSAHFQEQPSVTRQRTADPDVAFILFDQEHGGHATYQPSASLAVSSTREQSTCSAATMTVATFKSFN
jgi:hypothetical protein